MSRIRLVAVCFAWGWTVALLTACGVLEIGLEPTLPSATSTLPPTVPFLLPTLTVAPSFDFDPLPPGQKIRLSAIHMLDRNTGWGIGQLAGSPSDLLLLTGDGGRTWQNRTPRIVLQTLPPQGYTLTAFFGPAGRAWALFTVREAEGLPAEGLEVWRTTDFGQTWQPGKPLPLERLPAEYFIPVQFGFLDSGHGWLMARLGAGMSHDYVAVFLTADGGQTWQRVLDPLRTPDLMPCQKTGLAFTSPQEGWLTGDCPGLLPTLFLYITRDGGLTWQPVTLPVPPGQPADLFAGEMAGCGLTGIPYAGESGVSVVVRCLPYTGGKASAWFYAAKEGVNFFSNPLPQPYGGFHFLNLREGWFIGAPDTDAATSGEIYRTTDAGSTWRFVLSTGWQGTPYFLDADNGWVIARAGEKSALVRTTNGGLLWEEILPVTAP